MPKSTSVYAIPFCISYHLNITTPEVLYPFCCRWESWLWLREVEQFAQSHTASKVGVEIKKPSLLDTGMLPSLPHHTSTSSLRWVKLTLGRAGDMFVEWGPSWRHSGRYICCCLIQILIHGILSAPLNWYCLNIIPNFVKVSQPSTDLCSVPGAGISPGSSDLDHGFPWIGWERLLYPLGTLRSLPPILQCGILTKHFYLW